MIRVVSIVEQVHTYCEGIDWGRGCDRMQTRTSPILFLIYEILEGDFIHDYNAETIDAKPDGGRCERDSRFLYERSGL